MNIARLTRFPARRLALLLLAGSSLVGCSPVRMLDAVTPAGSYDRTQDIPFGPEARQRLDVYEPRDPDPRGTTIVFLYGGTWQMGDKADYRFVGEAMARQGIRAIIPDYRLYPEAQFPDYVDDAAAAVRWTRRRYSNVPLFLAGHSAGAHIAALVAFDRRYLKKAGLSPAAVTGFIGVAGPYDFLPIKAPDVKAVFASVDDLSRTQPINFVTHDAPPALLLHGREDGTVYPENSERLAAKLKAAGVPARLVVYPQRRHLDIMLGLSTVFAGDGALMSELRRFIADPRHAA